eukprot:11170033-Lingulodinium_polyedra.AAC.1
MEGPLFNTTSGNPILGRSGCVRQYDGPGPFEERCAKLKQFAGVPPVDQLRDGVVGSMQSCTQRPTR